MKRPVRYLLVGAAAAATGIGGAWLLMFLAARRVCPVPVSALLQSHPDSPNPLLSAAYAAGWTRSDLVSTSGSGANAVARLRAPDKCEIEISADAGGSYRISAITRDGKPMDVPTSLQGVVSKSAVLAILRQE